jgi:hypothetical protein
MRRLRYMGDSNNMLSDDKLPRRLLERENQPAFASLKESPSFKRIDMILREKWQTFWALRPMKD